MRKAGFFSQLRHGDPDGPDLYDAVRSPMPETVRPLIAEYLRGCHVVAATSARVGDALHTERESVSAINLHTDGLWVWPEDLAYYVETYGARLPDDLHRRAMAGTIPTLSRELLDGVTDWVLSGMPVAPDAAGEQGRR